MKTRLTSPSNPRAFTLIEVMIATAVFAIVLAAINGIFWGALRLRQKTVDSIEAALPQEQALAIIRNDLANIVPPGGTFFGTFQTAGSTTNMNGGLPPSTIQGVSSPQFTTSNGHVDDNSNWSDVQRVSYALANSAAGEMGRALVRSVTRNLLPALQQENEQQMILRGVENIYFSYYDGSQWQSAWTTNATFKLPRAIRVQIAMASELRGRLAPPPLELVVPLVDAGTNELATTTQ